MTIVQNRKKTSQVMYNSFTSPRSKTSGKAQNMKRYFPDEFHKESNRTVGPPFRAVGSPLPIILHGAVFVNPILGFSAGSSPVFVTIDQMEPPNFYVPSCKTSKTHLEIIAKI